MVPARHRGPLACLFDGCARKCLFEPADDLRDVVLIGAFPCRLELCRVEPHFMGVGYVPHHDVVSLAFHGAHESDNGMTRSVLRVQVDRRGINTPFAILEHQVKLLSARAGYRGRNDWGCRGALQRVGDFAHTLGVVLHHPTECLERDGATGLVRKIAVGVVGAPLLKGARVAVERRLRIAG
jgi:hypothetical protein